MTPYIFNTMAPKLVYEIFRRVLDNSSIYKPAYFQANLGRGKRVGIIYNVTLASPYTNFRCEIKGMDKTVFHDISPMLIQLYN